MNRNTPRRLSTNLKTFKLLESARANAPSLTFARDLFGAFRDLLDHPDAVQDEEFCRIVGLASDFRLLGMSQKEIANHFGVTPETLQRWMNGGSLPVKIVRKAYLDELAKLAGQQVDRLPTARPRTSRQRKVTDGGASPEACSNVISAPFGNRQPLKGQPESV